MTRRGKIARLPAALREELNQRLLDGKEGKQLVEWLNGLPQVQAVMQAEFEGHPISEPNLTARKQGGYVAWEAGQRMLDTVCNEGYDGSLNPELARPPELRSMTVNQG